LEGKDDDDDDDDDNDHREDGNNPIFLVRKNTTGWPDLIYTGKIKGYLPAYNQGLYTFFLIALGHGA